MEATRSEMPAHVARMVEEQAQLAARLNALDKFISGGGATSFQSLPAVQQRLMFDQYEGMRAYLAALSARIALS